MLNNHNSFFSRIPVPYNSNGAGWKIDADGNIELRDGNPVYVDAAGQELALGADTVKRLNAEAKTHRERADALAVEVKKFEGIDPDKARDAVDKLTKIDQKKLIDAGEVEKVREEIGKSFSEKITALETENKTLKTDKNGLIVAHQFSSSKFISEKVAVPLPMFKNTFAKNFTVDENGNTVPTYDNGNKVYSKKKSGELADFDEAIEILVSESGFSDSILKGGGHSGSGNGGGGGNGGGDGVRKMTKSQLQALSPAQQMEAMTSGKVMLVD